MWNDVVIEHPQHTGDAVHHIRRNLEREEMIEDTKRYSVSTGYTSGRMRECWLPRFNEMIEDRRRYSVSIGYTSGCMRECWLPCLTYHGATEDGCDVQCGHTHKDEDANQNVDHQSLPLQEGGNGIRHL